MKIYATWHPTFQASKGTLQSTELVTWCAIIQPNVRDLIAGLPLQPQKLMLVSNVYIYIYIYIYSHRQHQNVSAGYTTSFPLSSVLYCCYHKIKCLVQHHFHQKRYQYITFFFHSYSAHSLISIDWAHCFLKAEVAILLQLYSSVLHCYRKFQFLKRCLTISSSSSSSFIFLP